MRAAAAIAAAVRGGAAKRDAHPARTGARVMLLGMDDASVQAHIEELVAEEHRLLSAASEGQGLAPDQHERLERIKVELDRYWDLLRQRRAREEFGLDPDFAGLRDERTVEHFEQ
jgi:predicted nuclease with TOPRIM domain